MRKFVNVNKNRQQALSKKFPDIENLGCDDQTEKYEFVAITVFDHWLTRDEAEKSFGSQISKEDQEKRNSSFMRFRELLFNETEVLTYRCKGKGRNEFVSFKAFTSINAGLEYTYPTISNVGFHKAGGPHGRFFQVVLPSIDAVYRENYDDTNLLYYKNKSTLEVIEKLTEACGLFCLK
jgi:hypothetical protein